MAKIEVSRDSFKETVRQGGIVLIDCWAPWCAACGDFAPVFDRVADRRPQHVFAKLDTHVETELTEGLEIHHVPTLMLYRDGVLLLKQPGYLDEEALEGVLDQAEGLDMDLVRAELTAQESG